MEVPNLDPLKRVKGCIDLFSLDGVDNCDFLIDKTTQSIEFSGKIFRINPRWLGNAKEITIIRKIRETIKDGGF